MSYQQDAGIKIRQQRSKQAVALAMAGKWREALAANKTIVENVPRDVEAHNRIGRAHMELGELEEARKAYQQAIDIDPFNNIARKNLDRLSTLAEAPVKTNNETAQHAQPQIFIEDIGKSGVVGLVNPAPKTVLAKMNPGDVVNLRVEGNSLIVESLAGDVLGSVDPRHAQRLIRLTQGGNKYTAAIVSASDDKVTAVIREVYQDPAQTGQLSFPPKGLKAMRPAAGRGPRGELEFEEEAVEESGPDAGEIYEDAGRD